MGPAWDGESLHHLVVGLEWWPYWVAALDHAPKMPEAAFRMSSAVCIHEYIEEDGLELGVHEREPVVRQDEALVAIAYAS